jgi:hypothetical protein
MPLLLLLPVSCRPACLRLGVASVRACKDVDTHTPAPGDISPGWDAASGPVPHLLLPLPFPFPPLHLPSLLRLNRVKTGRVRCRRGRLDRFGHDARARPRMLGVHEGVRRGGVPHLLRGLMRGLRSRALPLGSCAGATYSTRCFAVDSGHRVTDRDEASASDFT